MRLIDGSIRRPVTVFMTTLGVVLFGLVAASRLSVDLLPDISYPSLTVRTDLPDAAPGDVEQFVTRPVEEGVGVVPGLVRLHSVSRPGQSEVTLEFATGTRMDLASLAVREKLDLVSLPREARRPAVLRFDPSLDPIMRLRLSGGGNLLGLRRIAEHTVKADLEGAPGVAAVKVVGGEEQEISVDVDAHRLSAVGLTLADVSTRLAEENINLAGGSLTEGQSEYLIRATNQFLSPEEIGRVILASRPEGVVRLADVASVGRGAKDRDVVARLDGREAVEISIYKEGDANTVAVARAVKRRIQRLPLPAAMKMVTVADQSRYIDSAIRDVTDAAWLGGLLAVLVLFAFLRQLGTTIIVALSIPVSVLATFIIMYRLGLSLNLMSLGGLALAVGNLVDASIVVLESIFKKREEGLDARRAAGEGTAIVAMAVTASTLTSVAVFFPLVFVEGLAGQLFRDQALTISFSHLVSLAVALTLVPTLYALGARGGHPAGAAAGAPATTPGPQGRWRRILGWATFAVLALPRLLTRGARSTGRRARPWVDRLLIPFDVGYGALVRVYPGLLRRALARRGRVLGLATALFVLTVVVGLVLPRNLFPSFTQGEFHFNVRLPEGAALKVTDAALDRLARVVSGDPRVKFVTTSAGQTDLAAFAGSAREANRGQVAVVLKDAGDRRGEEQVAARLREAMDQVPGLSYEFERPALLSFKNPVEVEIYAYDLDSLRTLAEAVAQRVTRVRGVEDVQSSMRLGDPEVQIAFDRDRLAAMDLDPATASRLVRSAIQGEAATQYSDLDRKLDVRVRASEAQRSVVAELANLDVGRTAGRAVSLGAVADVRVARGPAEIRRIAQQRAAVVSANLKGRDLSAVAQDIQAALDGMAVPPGAKVTLAGQNRELGESFGSLRFAILLAVFLVYLVMASQFESLLHPFVIMFTLPMALVGVVATLLLTGTTLSVMVLIGMVVMAGIVVNNGIVLIDYTKRLRARGLSKVDALIEAGQVRMRPILMTTLTTVLGLVPMAIGVGEGAALRAPLAITLIGGMMSSTLLTLVVLPVVYATLDRKP
ncbi:MAG: efflux RND transporter permease subunit [Candidatus Eisenbacteria bacterium]|uniref:Efflux RND transporter permease subunit n=1 Tax=Eiseniibacteriota bacterium TaxID=2212470 RepID=A0A538UCP4_UNCEI|nr:MAG: efflux RND transporter permease subunit [Candidatus Eisenbacteria bacterium]